MAHGGGRGSAFLYFVLNIWSVACALKLCTIYDSGLGVCHSWFAYVYLYDIIILIIVQVFKVYGKG